MNLAAQHLTERIIHKAMTGQPRQTLEAPADDAHPIVAAAALGALVAGVPGAVVVDRQRSASQSGAGPVGIMPEHAPLLGTVDTGILTYRDLEKQERQVNVGPGFFMVSSDGVSIVARSAELVS